MVEPSRLQKNQKLLHSKTECCVVEVEDRFDEFSGQFKLDKNISGRKYGPHEDRGWIEYILVSYRQK